MLRSPHPQTNLRAGAIAGLGLAVEANGIGSELRDVAAYIGIPPITMKPYLVALALISAVAVALTPVLTKYGGLLRFQVSAPGVSIETAIDGRSIPQAEVGE